MHHTTERLLHSFREILASPDLMPEGTANDPGEALDVSLLAAEFEPMFGVPCPPTMQVGLGLPAEVSVRWQLGADVSGEIQVKSLLTAMYSTLDPSLEDRTIQGHRLGDMRIADAVLVKAGPLHVVFEVKSDRISDQLFLFNAKELWPLELSYDAYLDMAAATRSVVYWQLLFRDLGLTKDEQQVLSAELDFLEARFPAQELKELRLRLTKRS